MTSTKVVSRTLPIMIVIILIGFFLRLFHLTTVPLRGDEAFTVQYWASQPLADALAKTATIEPHPLMTYVIFRGWGLAAGYSELAMRMLPALIGLLGIPAIYAVGKRLSSPQIGLLAALLFALHPYEIWHAQDARNYAIWAGVSLTAVWLGLRTLDKQRPRDWLLYTLAVSLAANIFYTELLTLAAFGLYVLITYWGKWKTVLSWGLAAGIAGVLSVVSFLVFQFQLFQRNGYSGSIGGMLDVSKLWTHFLPVLNFGEVTLPPDTLNSLWPIVAIVILAGLIVVWRTQRRVALWLTLLALLPPILLTIFAAKLDIFTPRYVLSIVPAYILIIASLTIYLRQQMRPIVGSLAGAILVAGWLIVSGTSLSNYYFDPAYAKAKNWPELAHYLQQNAQPNDVVIQSAADSAFGYYYHQTTLAIPQDVALPATPQQPISDVQAILEIYSQQKNAIWQVGQEFPDWPNAGVVKHWLDEHMQLVLVGNPGGLNMLQYKKWQVAPNEISQTVSADFGNMVKLVGYKLLPPAEPSGNLTVWLYWTPLKATDVSLKVFVHLLGATKPATNSPLWTQDDHFPQNGLISTQNWSPNELYRDVYVLPLTDVPNGSYTLEVGFYNPNTMSRLKVGSGDSYILQTIDLK